MLNKEHLEIEKITDCDSLLNHEVFKRNTEMTWPDNKPKNVVDAVKLFDSMTNELHDHWLNICPPSQFYFGLGMHMRSEWFHQGTTEFRDQIENKLELHPDISSGIVISLYVKMKNKEI